jgi:uncharacterized protein with HEPN domain
MPRKKKPDAAYLSDMLTSARFVNDVVETMSLAEYQKNMLIRMAVERGIEIIGEAAYSVSEEFKAAHQEIPWSKIMRQRNRLAHDYDDIDDVLIWNVATVHVPDLIVKLGPLIPPVPPSPA